MASADSQSRLQFLKESADSLKLQSPSTSAHLMSVHNQIRWDGFSPLTSSQRQASCGACGSIRASGLAGSTDKGSHRKNQALGPEDGCIYECPRCHRRTFPVLRKQKPLQKSRTSTSTVKTPLTRPLPEPKDEGVSNHHLRETSASSDPKASGGNTSSKKRARVRKQQGLQALVAAGKQTSQTSPSASLDLFDFLQQ